jgi:alanine or glycine:cation symporter, AGCS family
VFPDLNYVIEYISAWIWGWPLVIGVIAVGLIMTVALRGIQIRYFFTSWRYVFSLEHGNDSKQESYITPIQAFLTTLSSSIGNGSAAGMATAMYSGGPGAALWVFLLGFLYMAVRFAEVYASTTFMRIDSHGVMRGGPMVFLRYVPGGRFLPSLYALFCLLASFVAGSAMQCNSIQISLTRITGLNSWAVGVVLFVFVLYSMLGGSRRIIAISDRIVPIKVGLFFVTMIIILFYHYKAFIPSLKLIIASAFTSKALGGALLGHTMQNALRFGISRSLSATEAGLGTAGVLFGATGSYSAVKNGIVSMASIVVSNHLVCCTLLLMFVVTGVWNSGLTSTALTAAAYETVFGALGSWIVAFLSIAFGLGVLVAYAYIGRECWMFLTGGRRMTLYMMIYAAMAFIGSVYRADSVWNALDIANAGMVVINLYGLLWLLPSISRAVASYES